MLTAGVYGGGAVKRLYWSPDDGEGGEGSLECVPPRLGGGGVVEAERGERGEGLDVLKPQVCHVGAVAEVEAE